MIELQESTCRSYARGHQAHWILAKRNDGYGRPGVVLGFDGDRVVVRAHTGETHTWWHHLPLQLRAALACRGRAVMIHPELPALQLGALWFHCSPEATSCTSVSTGRSPTTRDDEPHG